MTPLQWERMVLQCKDGVMKRWFNATTSVCDRTIMILNIMAQWHIYAIVQWSNDALMQRQNNAMTCWQCTGGLVVVVVQSVAAFALHAEGWVFELRRPILVTAPLSNAWQHVWMLRVLRDGHINRCPFDSRCSALKNPYCSMAMSAVYR